MEEAQFCRVERNAQQRGFVQSSRKRKASTYGAVQPDMMPRHAPELLLLTALLCAPGALHAAPPAAWSAQSDALSGRLVLAKSSVARSGALVVLLELKASAPRTVLSDNPFAVDLEVRDSAGKVVRPSSWRIDVLSSARARTIRPGATLRFKVTIKGVDARGVQLDTVIKLWKLSRGAYTLRGVYSSKGFKRRKGAQGARWWSGALKLPP